MTLTKRPYRLLMLFFFTVLLFSAVISAAECSKTKLCATGCCSSAGYCGTTKDHCGKGCLSTCDFKLECDKSNPCKGNACCSKYGHCGLGPDFCGKDCVAGCDAKGECDPGGFGSKFANHTKCPLNVCCSKHGYCGTTKDFCGKKTVNRPSCSAKGPMRRVVGYIEGWASTRSCDSFRPSNIPDGVYTHINFAFASIDPKTFQIVPASSKDPALYRELTRKKKIDPKLKVFIAIGGWAFNDPGPTVTTFSDIARSDANQRTFIKSLISFMATYGFDGIDIDWEYPAADDREGREEDFANLPKFLSNIKSALKQSGERNGLSIAIPASYWYLQHFDLEKISKYVDHFNVMSYDFHGAWDTPKSWLGNHLNSHTNLTEIKEAFDLLWRNDVDPNQVNMGLAFYARTFTASSSSCMSPGCLFDAGGPAEPCTDAVGVMSNPEIMRKLGGKIGSGDLDKAAAIKTLKFGTTWLTYDDVDTWKLKLDFARSQCLGGAMVWAISQDTSDGKFSKQLQEATGYKSKGVTTFNSTKSLGGGVFIETTESEANADVSDEQCRWTNCRETCPSGWSTVLRRDPYRTSSSEIMMDGTACGGNGIRTFCCPPKEQPFCQWLFHNNGACKPGCPYDDMVEVASTKLTCDKGKAQVACCRGDTPALDVYRQYKWYGKESECAIDQGEKQCGWSSKFDSQFVTSWSGSGGQVCYDSHGKQGDRPLCENTRDETKPHFSNCIWSDDYYVGRKDTVTTGTCNSNCPKGMVKVTLQSENNNCNKGTSAYCCDVTASYDFTDIKDDELEVSFKEWAKKPTCPNLGGLAGEKLSSRSLGNMAFDVGEQLSELVERDDALLTVPFGMTILLAFQRIMTSPPGSRNTRDLQDLIRTYITPKWAHITVAYIAGMLWEIRDDVKTTLITAWNFICNMDAEEKEAKRIANLPSSSRFCHIPSLNTYDPGSLEDPRGKSSVTEIFGPIGPIGGVGGVGDLKFPFNEMKWSTEWLKDDALEKRAKTYGSARPFTVECPGGNPKWVIKSMSYPSGDNGDHLAEKSGDKKKYYVDNLGSCVSAIVMDNGHSKDGNKYISEHILELQSVPMFMEYTMGIQKRLQTRLSRSGLPIKAPFNPDSSRLLPCTFWVNDFQYGFAEWNNKYGTTTPTAALFALLGSTQNSEHMVNTESKFNGKKGALWEFKEPVGGATWNDQYAAVDDTTVLHAFEQLILVEQVFPYLAKPGIQDKLLGAHQDVTAFLDEYEELYRKQHPTAVHMGLSDMWRNFMTELLTKMKDWAEEWLKFRIDIMVQDWTAEHARREAVARAYTVAGDPKAAAAAAAAQASLRYLRDAEKHSQQYSSFVASFDPSIFQTTPDRDT
ncbi:class V chitinase [Fusarium pseudocircinatum]|uniref:chitinase n=1 Tax=Fusarium pseudocircinatum TaxID=56676 RepID=A0A8H5UN63_9HYPO|nr:class V chitinase [Fusarium pseudocircinatum]